MSPGPGGGSTQPVCGPHVACHVPPETWVAGHWPTGPAGGLSFPTPPGPGPGPEIAPAAMGALPGVTVHVLLGSRGSRTSGLNRESRSYRTPVTSELRAGSPLPHLRASVRLRGEAIHVGWARCSPRVRWAPCPRPAQPRNGRRAVAHGPGHEPAVLPTVPVAAVTLTSLFSAPRPSAVQVSLPSAKLRRFVSF